MTMYINDPFIIIFIILTICILYGMMFYMQLGHMICPTSDVVRPRSYTIDVNDDEIICRQDYQQSVSPV